MIEKCATILGLVVLMGAVAHADDSTLVSPKQFILTDSQMDTVSAGALVVWADAVALSASQPAHTRTSTDAAILNGSVVEQGFATAMALSCCGPATYARISLGAASDSDIFRMHRRIVTRTVRGVTYSYGFVYAFATARPSGLVRMPLMARHNLVSNFLARR